jgi:hypothetical protein
MVYTKVTEEGLAVMAGKFETTTVTLTMAGVRPGDEIVTVPVKVPAVVSAAVFRPTLTELVALVVPDAGLTVSQDPDGEAAAVKASPVVPPIATGWVGGAAVPV